MKIMRFVYHAETLYGVVQDDQVLKIEGWPGGPYSLAAPPIPLAEVKPLVPILPGKIVAVGLNYAAHASEMKANRPAAPLLFLKPSTAVIGPEEGILYPENCRELHFEGELAVIIKKKARKVPPEQAKDYVLGYTCLNDVTARDWQRADGQWTRGKSYDTFCPVGPVIAMDLPDPNNLKLETRLNGEIRQKASTADLLFSVEELISYISAHMTLLPGDLIATGTPDGVGPMQVGDTVEVEIEGIGVLRNKVVADR